MAARSRSRKVTLGFALPLTIVQVVSNTDMSGKASVHQSSACWLVSSEQNIRCMYFDVRTMNDTFENYGQGKDRMFLLLGMRIRPPHSAE